MLSCPNVICLMTSPITEPFVEFPKIARLSREMILTEKLDGTNALIEIQEDGTMRFGSRTRWITPEEDNYGFARWATEHREELSLLGPGRHFGEWWGGGIQRNYGLAKDDKRFWMFNVIRWCLATVNPERIPTVDQRIIKMQQQLPACVGLVPVLHRGEFSTSMATEAICWLRINGSKAVPGFTKPEGVCIYHVASGVTFKKTVEKDEQPKSFGL